MLDNLHNLSIYIPSIFHYASDSDSDPDPDDDTTMGSPTPDSRRSGGGGLSRRDSIRSNSGGGRRPRLLRSVATEPSITPSTASRNGLASPQDTRRATDLLNQFSSSPPNSSSPLSQSPSSMYDAPSMDSMPREDVDMESFRPHLDSNRYFSFPSFDTWEPDQSEHDHREPEMKSP